MAKSSTKQMAVIARWLFIIGIIIAVIVGLFGSYIGITLSDAWVAIVLLIIGILVGFLNVTEKESMPFLLAGTALVIINYCSSGALGALPWAQEIVKALSVLLVPATIIVALKTVISLAKD
jgi:hypothetical protein